MVNFLNHILRAAKKYRTGIFCGILIFILLFSLLAVYPALTSRRTPQAQGYEGVVRIWQIDSFEGGKGSRAAFLNRAARNFEKEHPGILFIVSSHSAESAQNSYLSGDVPDIISYGNGIEFAAELASPLKNCFFSFATSDGKTYATPWCRGQYFLFSKDGDFSDMDANNTVLSQSGLSQTQLAAYLEGLRGDLEIKESIDAYQDFLSGKYQYLFGSQRDIWRFEARDIEVKVREVQSFCDLWQYISICSSDKGKRDISEDFIQYLLSESVQKQLVQIGMLSPNYKIYSGVNNFLQTAEKKTYAFQGISVFISRSGWDDLKEYAGSALKGDESCAKKLQNYLL